MILFFLFFSITHLDPIRPQIQIDEKVDFKPELGSDFLLSYNVTSYPASLIQWWKSEDGKHYQFITQCPPRQENNESITRCSPRLEMCDDHPGKQKISNTSFEIKDLKYPEDDLFYMCNASNEYGNDSKVFELKVYGNVVDIMQNEVLLRFVIITIPFTRIVIGTTINTGIACWK